MPLQEVLLKPLRHSPRFGVADVLELGISVPGMTSERVSLCLSAACLFGFFIRYFEGGGFWTGTSFEGLLGLTKCFFNCLGEVRGPPTHIQGFVELQNYCYNGFGDGGPFF